MFNLTWEDALSVNNSIIDGQHKELISIFNKAYDALQNHDTDIELIEVISHLSTYSIFHFREEEQLMKKGHLPDYEEHVEKHQYFINKVREFKNSLSYDNSELKEEVFLFLANWLMEHIQVTDQDYKAYIK